MEPWPEADAAAWARAEAQIETYADGLPIVPPTADRVGRMLAANGVDPEALVCELAPLFARANGGASSGLAGVLAAVLGAGGDACSGAALRNELQKRHLIASSWMSSAQNGHFFMVFPLRGKDRTLRLRRCVRPSSRFAMTGLGQL